MPSSRKAPPWQVILEEIRSQNRATIEAVQVNRVSLEARMDRFQRETESRFDLLEGTVKGNREAIERAQQAIDGNRQAVEAQGAAAQLIEQVMTSRMDALERTLGQMDQAGRARVAGLDLALRELKVSVQQNGVDVRELAGKIAALARLEERVAALERRGA